MTVRLSLPFPPTTNNLFVNVPGKGRVKSPTYRKWLSAASSECWGVKGVLGRYHLTLTAERPDRRARDLSNLIKAVEDLLTHVGLIEDDYLAETILLSWAGDAPVKSARVHVVGTAFSEAQAA